MSYTRWKRPCGRNSIANFSWSAIRTNTGGGYTAHHYAGLNNAGGQKLKLNWSEKRPWLAHWSLFRLCELGAAGPQQPNMNAYR